MLIITLLAIIALLLAAIVVLIITRPKVVKIYDAAPKDGRNTSKVMKLSNELAGFIYDEDGFVCIDVVKK